MVEDSVAQSHGRYTLSSSLWERTYEKKNSIIVLHDNHINFCLIECPVMYLSICLWVDLVSD